jgi:hypothetical protein
MNNILLIHDSSYERYFHCEVLQRIQTDNEKQKKQCFIKVYLFGTFFAFITRTMDITSVVVVVVFGVRVCVKKLSYNTCEFFSIVTSLLLYFNKIR